ncbi:glycosyltransferase [bacterium]|nr:glycosyltransferase [bacterium]
MGLFYYAWRLKKTAKDEVILSFMERANFVNIIAKLFFKHKAIVSERIYPSIAFNKGLRRIQKYLVSFLYPYADLIIANSKAIKEDLIENFKIPSHKIKVINNMYDIEQIEIKAQKKISQEFAEFFQSPVIINIGSHSTQKGQKYLIKAFKKVVETLPQVKLAFFGRGPLKPGLIKLVQDLKLEPNVKFFDFDENIFKYLSKSKLFVLSSLWEGFPNVLIEAMACKLPVIASDCKSGPREILAPTTDCSWQTKELEFAEYGVLVPPEEEELLSRAILKVLKENNLSESYSAKGYNRAKDFTIQNMLSKWKKYL